MFCCIKKPSEFIYGFVDFSWKIYTDTHSKHTPLKFPALKHTCEFIERSPRKYETNRHPWLFLGEREGSALEREVDENFSVLLECRHLARRIYTCVPGAIKF